MIVLNSAFIRVRLRLFVKGGKGGIFCRIIEGVGRGLRGRVGAFPFYRLGQRIVLRDRFHIAQFLADAG